MTIRRRDFFVSALALGATANRTSMAGSSSDQYELSILPAQRRVTDGPTICNLPNATAVEFVAKLDLEEKYQTILADFVRSNPLIDLRDPASYLIVAKSKQSKIEGDRVADCACQCGTGKTCSGGGKGGPSRRAPSKT